MFGKGYKILIADDECIIRERLKLNVEKAGFRIAGQAENGFQALDLYEKTRPDIIISDIFMPAMSGTELLETIRKSDDRVKFIFLTGYNEFDYALSALKNNASDFILKPLDTNKLYEVLQNLVNELEEERELKSLKRENKLIKDGICIDHFLSYGDIHPDTGRKLAALLQCPDGARLLMIYGRPDWVESGEEVYPIENDIYLVFFRQYGRGIRALCTSDCYAAVGAPCRSGRELRESFLYLRRILLYRFFSPRKHLYDREVYEKADKEKVRAMDQQNRTLFLKNKAAELTALIDAELAELKTPADLEYYVYLIKGLVFRKSEGAKGVMLNDHSAIWILEQFSALSEFGAWLKALIRRALSENCETSELDLTTRVKQYLEENYASSVTLGSIAVNVFAHPNYISTRFREDVGVTVTEYLSSLRLERARDLLNTTDLACKEISRIVGFKDQFYFGKCFKKKFGITPTALQKAAVNNG